VGEPKTNQRKRAKFHAIPTAIAESLARFAGKGAEEPKIWTPAASTQLWTPYAPTTVTRTNLKAWTQGLRSLARKARR